MYNSNFHKNFNENQSTLFAEPEDSNEILIKNSKVLRIQLILFTNHLENQLWIFQRLPNLLCLVEDRYMFVEI